MACSAEATAPVQGVTLDRAFRPAPTGETPKSHRRRLAEGFYDRYLSGEAVLDIGYRGGSSDAEPVTAHAIGVELDYPGYDGVHLPFPDCSQDAVFASHCLEHIVDWQSVLADWFRVLKIGGYLVIAVPHQFLYERKADLPSRFNGDHKRFYTPGSLLAEIEAALPVAAWRLRSLRDVDDGFSYDTPPEVHAIGCYEIELVVQRIAPPGYASRLVPSAPTRELARFFARLLNDAVEARIAGLPHEVAEIQAILAPLPLPSFVQLERHLPSTVHRSDLAAVLRPLVAQAPFDEADYLARYPDVRRAVEDGRLASGHAHYVHNGYFEGRFANPVPQIFA